MLKSNLYIYYNHAKVIMKNIKRIEVMRDSLFASNATSVIKARLFTGMLPHLHNDLRDISKDLAKDKII